MNEFTNSNSEFGTPDEPQFPMHSGARLLVAIGVGLAVGALVHMLRPAPKPQQRLARILQEMEDSLRQVSTPAVNKIGDLATEGAQVFNDRLHRGEAQVEKLLRGATSRLRRFVS